MQKKRKSVFLPASVFMFVHTGVGVGVFGCVHTMPMHTAASGLLCGVETGEAESIKLVSAQQHPLALAFPSYKV